MRKTESDLIDKIKRAGAVAGFGLASLFGANNVAQGGMIYAGTELPRKTMVSGSDRDYSVMVYVDNTDNEPAGMRYMEFKVGIALSKFYNIQLDITESENPSQKPWDIWKDISLQNNTIDSNLSDQWWGTNIRGPPVGGESEHWKGYIGKFTVRVKPNILPYSGKFVSNSWDVGDTNYSQHTPLPDGNGTLTVASDTYTIVNTLSRFDKAGNEINSNDPMYGVPDGDVDGYDVDAFRACTSGAQVPYALGCEWADADGDNDVDQDDFGVIQRCLNGDDKPVDANDPNNSDCFAH